MEKLILVCNDDGIDAKGIHALAKVAKRFGKVVVIAPDSPQSGMGHAISVSKPLRLKPYPFGDGLEAYACSGTPADCVKMATGVVLHRKPDLVLSGVNHGLNASISVFYSGTMSAAMEGAIEGVPSIGFSLADFSADADFSASERIIEIVLKNHFHYGTPENTTLNINIPRLPLEQIKGIKVCRQAYGRWVEEFEERLDPHGRKYWWLAGRFSLNDEGSDTDIWAIENGYVSICPVNIDATAHHTLPHVNRWKLDNLDMAEVRETAPHFVEFTPPE